MNRYLRSTRAAVLIAFTLALIFSVGCSKDETPTDTGGSDSVRVSGIICNPLAPSPNPPDTVISVARLTVRAEGQGAAANYQWEVEAGTLRSSSGISVEWEVPSEGIYRVSVTATAGSDVHRDTTWVMVRNCMAIETGLRYAFYPNLIEGELYCVGTNSSSLIDRSFLGYHAYKLDMIPPSQMDQKAATDTATIIISGGYDFKFYSDGILAATITNGAEYMRLQPMNVIFYPYLPGFQRTYWSRNEFAGTTFRKRENYYPSASSGLDMVVWQRNRVGLTDDGKQDLVNIRFRFSSGPIRSLTTAKDSLFQLGAWNYRYWRNIRPLLTPDESMIIYFVDSTGTFEPCLIPVEGSEPDLTRRRAIMVDTRRGIFYYAGVKISAKTVFQWDPANPERFAFIDDKQQFCVFNYALEKVDVLGTGLQEFVFSEDGKIAAVAEDGVYVLEPGQTVAKRVFTKERSTDAVIGVNWSSGGSDERLGFRMVRKGASSLESYAVLVIYSMNDDRWYYASPEIKPVATTDPAVNYEWMRAEFDPLAGGMYIPVPISTSGGKSVIYYSY